MKIKKILMILSLFFVGLFCFSTLTSCSPAEDKIQRNLLRDIGNFQTYRKITVINLRSGEILMEFEGYLTSKLDSEKDLNIMIRISEGEYQLHYVRLATEITYLSEQLDVTPSSPYYYKISIYVPYPKVENPNE